MLDDAGVRRERRPLGEADEVAPVVVID